MLLQDMYELMFRLAPNHHWLIRDLAYFITVAYESNNYILVNYEGKPFLIFYGFCSLAQARKIVETQQSIEAIKAMSEKRPRDEAVFVLFACGTMNWVFKSLWKHHLRLLGVKALVYYKPKVKRYFLLEVK